MKSYPLIGFIAVLIFILYVFSIQDTYATTFTAVASGNWDNPATWGGTVPSSTDIVIIPNEITVTIPLGLTVTVASGGTITINNIGGTITNFGTITINSGGVINNYGFITNYSTITINSGGVLINNFGGIINNIGGSINNNFNLGNGGTINKFIRINYSSFDSNSANDQSSIQTTVIVPDATSPVITPTVTGTLGNNGWYVSDVTVYWDVIDAESSITSTTGCETSVINSDNIGITLTCSAISTGGANSQDITIKRDATLPTIIAPTASLSPLLGTPTVGDNLDSSLIVTNNAPDTFAPGTTTIVTWRVTDHAGNYASATQQVTIVTWSVTDRVGNYVSATQQVTVTTPGQAINDLIILGNSYGANTNVLKNAQALLDDNNQNNDNGACGKLDKFINQVNSNNSLSSTQKTQLIQDANAIKTNIGC